MIELVLETAGHQRPITASRTVSQIVLPNSGGTSSTSLKKRQKPQFLFARILATLPLIQLTHRVEHAVTT